MPIDKLFANLNESPSAKGALSGAASGAMVSLLMNKKARKKIGKSAAQLGGIAALAGVGYFGYKKWQESRANPADSGAAGGPSGPDAPKPLADTGTPRPAPAALPRRPADQDDPRHDRLGQRRRDDR